MESLVIFEDHRELTTGVCQPRSGNITRTSAEKKHARLKFWKLNYGVADNFWLNGYNNFSNGSRDILEEEHEQNHALVRHRYNETVL